jgi:hypothetical protein
VGKENAEVALSLVGYEEELKVCFFEFQFVYITIKFTAHIQISSFIFWYRIVTWVLKAFSMSLSLF